MLRTLPEIEEHPRANLARKIGVARVAKFIGLSPSYLYALLQGTYPGTPQIQQKLNEVLDGVEKGTIRI